MCVLTCIVGGGFLDLIVALPWEAAVRAWDDSETALLRAQGCSLASLNALFAHSMNLATRLDVMGQIIQAVGAMLALIWIGAVTRSSQVK